MGAPYAVSQVAGCIKGKPSSLPPEKVAKLGPPKVPLIVAVMLVKQQGAWKIAHTTFVPRDKD